MKLSERLLTLFFIFFSVSASAEGEGHKVTYRLPLDLPVSLSGSFGELRATHFHSGVDFRIGGVSGARLYAANSGFISRITVSPTGYGNAIYIQHRDGKTTLYGHMHDFAPKIQRWVTEQQYLRESFALNLFPDSTLFPVKRGDFIGRAGNSGSSAGPHLHYEVRETSTELPLNPLSELSIEVLDNMPPVIQRVNFYAITDPLTLPQTRLLASYTEAFQGIVSVSDTFYIAVAAVDRQNNTSARLAVARYNYYLNNRLIYSFTPFNVPFDQGRYINSVVEFSEKQQRNLSMIKSFSEPGGGLKQNIIAENYGLFVLEDDNINTVTIELFDEHNNVTRRDYRVRRGAESPPSLFSDSLNITHGVVMPWFLPNRFEGDGLRFMLPPGALYSTILFRAEQLQINGRTLWRVHDNNTPVHNHGRIALRTDLPPHLTDKGVIVMINGNGRESSIGGVYKNGWIEASTASFGVFGVALDTVPPVITPQFKNGENLSGRSYLRFTISDNLSGIASYRVYIDDKWIVTAYDPKNRRLETTLSSDRMTKGRKHSIEVVVTDNRGNTNNFKSTFIW